MILRRVIEHVREQNWTAICVEFVLLVLGVFLGIQAANWNSTMIERGESRDSLQRLEEDLRLSIKLTQSNAEFMTEGARDADQMRALWVNLDVQDKRDPLLVANAARRMARKSQ